MSRLQGKTVVVTGASSGIGQACAFEFAKAGSNLVLTARRHDRLVEIKKEIEEKYPGVKVHPLELDVQDRAKVFSSFTSLPVEFADVHVLVNNAGLVKGVDTVENVTEEAIDIMFGTNVKGLLNVTQALLPGFKKRDAGFIINISSISGTQVYPGGGVYCATKHAVDALTRTLRLELVSTGINVSSIDPGMVETEFSVVRFYGDKDKADKVYEGLDPLTGQDVAETVVFVASRPPHVNVANMLLLPTNQAAVHMVHRKTSAESNITWLVVFMEMYGLGGKDRTEEPNHQ
ncbi:hypothetical protein HDU67_004428 [Dinochytrium kinnereticum]|nr:hypothetical protein HDU67_004428 [Dinochytrium kinnereticum]